MSIIAVVPARAGSRRLKNKNILPFGGTNLLVHKIRQLKRVKGLDGIVVSSDSDEMLQMARDEGVDTHRREERYADDISVPFGEVVSNICQSISSDDVLWAPCTCPMTLPANYEDAIRLYKKTVPSDNDSLVAFERLNMFLWDDNGPINYGLGTKHVLSQDLPCMYRPTNGIFIAPRCKMIEWKYFHGVNPYKFIMDKKNSIDIDDRLDMMCARRYWLDRADFDPPFPGAKRVYIFSNVYKFNSDDEYLHKIREFGFEKGSVFVFINTIRHLQHGRSFFRDLGDIVILCRKGKFGKGDIDQLLADDAYMAKSVNVWNIYDDMTFTDQDENFLFGVSCPEYPEGKIPTSGYLAIKMANRLWPNAVVELINFYGNDDNSTTKWEGHGLDFEDAFLKRFQGSRFIEP